MPEQYYFKHGNITIGVFFKEESEIKYLPNISEADKLPPVLGYPPGIFELDKSKTPWMPCKTKVGTSERILKWFQNRTFSSERPDIKEILNDLNLDQYDLWEVIKRTKGFCRSDKYWISKHETEPYKRSTVSVLE